MEQLKVAVPANKRVNGWLYDASSGLCMGIASDERRAITPYNTPFKEAIGGCPMELVIHHSLVDSFGVPYHLEHHAANGT